MKILTFIVRILVITILVIFEQGLVIGIGILVYAQSSLAMAVVIWCLCIPMLYINYQTYKLIMKHGIINFMTMNADTSEIDVPKGKRWYDE